MRDARSVPHFLIDDKRWKDFFPLWERRMLAAGETGAPSLFFFFFNKSGVSRLHLCFGKYLRPLGEREVWGREEADDGDVIERNWVESSSSESYEAGELGQ